MLMTRVIDNRKDRQMNGDTKSMSVPPTVFGSHQTQACSSSKSFHPNARPCQSTRLVVVKWSWCRNVTATAENACCLLNKPS